MNTCPQCGFENKHGSSFCVKCGAKLETPAQQEQQAAPPQGGAEPPQPPPQAAGTTVPPAAPERPTTVPPGSYGQASPTEPTPAPPGTYRRAAPRGTYASAPPAYAARAGTTRGALFWIGALMVLVSGILILLSTFMTWGTGEISLTGWDWFSEQGNTDSEVGIALEYAEEYGEIVNPFFVFGEYATDSYPLFTGLCSLILGGIIALIGVLMLIFRSKGIGSMGILFSVFALGIAVANTVTMIHLEGISLRLGMYLFLIFSLAGLVGGSMAMAD